MFKQQSEEFRAEFTSHRLLSNPLKLKIMAESDESTFLREIPFWLQFTEPAECYFVDDDERVMEFLQVNLENFCKTKLSQNSPELLSINALALEQLGKDDEAFQCLEAIYHRMPNEINLYGLIRQSARISRFECYTLLQKNLATTIHFPHWFHILGPIYLAEEDSLKRKIIRDFFKPTQFNHNDHFKKLLKLEKVFVARHLKIHCEDLYEYLQETLNGLLQLDFSPIPATQSIELMLNIATLITSRFERPEKELLAKLMRLPNDFTNHFQAMLVDCIPQFFYNPAG